MYPIYEKQKQFFQSGQTRSLHFRLTQLETLKKLILTHEDELIAALHQDLHKSPAEAKLTEINIILEEIHVAQKQLSTWMKPTKVKTPFPALWRGKSFIQHQSYGVTLIMAPWNFPVQLCLAPLVGAIAGGNTVVLKPSRTAIYTHDLLIKLINHAFPEHAIHALDLQDTEYDALLDHPWNYVFFTGSPRVGKHVLSQLAKHLTPSTLELGGKSPCIVDETADITQTAKHIVWAKFLNAGQVCVAPDFILVHASQYHALTEALITTIKTYFGEDPSCSSDYGRIINAANYQRLMTLLDQSSILHGGRFNDETRYIEPTLIDHVTWQDEIMQDEIFGPLLPILTYESPDEIIYGLINKPSPLAFYCFSKNKYFVNHVMNQLPFGNGAINTCILQYSNLYLPFGGVGQSGIGRYHGKYSFDTFTYQQSIYERFRFPDITLHHPPYTPRKLKWLWRLLSL